MQRKQDPYTIDVGNDSVELKVFDGFRLLGWCKDERPECCKTEGALIKHGNPWKGSRLNRAHFKQGIPFNQGLTSAGPYSIREFILKGSIRALLKQGLPFRWTLFLLGSINKRFPLKGLV